MSYDIKLTNSKPIHKAVVRGCVPPKELAQFVPAACGEVWLFIRSAGLPRPGSHVALYLDAHGSVEVGAEVSEPFCRRSWSPRFSVSWSSSYSLSPPRIHPTPDKLKLELQLTLKAGLHHFPALQPPSMMKSVPVEE